MAAQLATESQWKTVVQKSKIKDNGLQKALAEYEKLGDDKSQEKVKALDAVKKLASGLGKDKAIAANADVAKFLDGLEAGVAPAKKEAEAAAKAQEANLAETQELCAQAETLVDSTTRELDGLGKQIEGSCPRERGKYEATLARVRRAIEAIRRAPGLYLHIAAMRNLNEAIAAMVVADREMHTCVRDAHQDMNHDLKSRGPELAALKGRLDRLGK